MGKTPFEGRILVLGCGSVAQCTLPLLLRHLDVSRERITPENYAGELARHVGPGDLIVDLAWNIECGVLLEFCRSNDVLYINTSVEVWNPYAGVETTTPP